MSAKVLQQLLVLLISQSGKNGEGSLRNIVIAIATAFCVVALLVSAVVYILTSPFELVGNLLSFQTQYSGLLTPETGIGSDVVTDTQIDALTSGIADPRRQQVIASALQLVGKVSYFWGGKSAPGWNDQWGVLTLVTSPGSATSDTYIPYGLDCSGFVNWAYCTALGENALLGYATTSIWHETAEIGVEDLQPGDLAFLSPPSMRTNHMGIYLGKGPDGKNTYIHCSYGGGGVVMNNYSGFQYFRRPSILTEEVPVR